MTTKTIVFAGGGTGGHLRPGKILGQELLRLHPDWRVYYLVSGRDVERLFLSQDDRAVELFPGQPSRPSLWRGDLYLRAWWKARSTLRELRPDLVIYLGGYVTALAVLASSHRPAILLESDRISGRASRLASHRVERIFAQWPAVEGGPTRRLVTGMPVPWTEMPDRAAACRELGLAPDRLTLLVLGGSQGARALNQRIISGLPDLAGVADLQVFHLTGASDLEWVRAAYRGTGVVARIVPFFPRVELLYAAADLVVARAGGMTVTEVCAAGRAAVLVPYPHHRDQHQESNARMLVDAGAAWMVRESERGADFAVHELLPRLADREELKRRGEAAALLGRRSARDTIVREIERLVA